MRKMRRKEEPEIIEETQELSSFPQLSDAIDSLRDQLAESSEERKNVISKWVSQLETINQQMRHLERIENFSDALKKQDEAEGDDTWGEIKE